MILPRHGLNYCLKHLFFELLNVFRVLFTRMQHLIFLLHHLTHVQERTQFKLGIRVITSLTCRIYLVLLTTFTMIFTLLTLFSQSLLCLNLGPSLHFIPAFLLTFRIILLKYVRRHHPLFEQFVLPEQFLHDLVTEAKLIDAILEIFTRHEVADTDATIASDCQVANLGKVYNLFHSKDFVFTKQIQLNLF